MTQDPRAFIAALDEVDLPRFRVVGTYTRYDEAVRNALQDARQKILAGFEPPGRKRENHLIWAAPGTGKTYFIQQVAASLPSGIRYHELNLAKCSEAEFRSGLASLEGNEACLCLVDEVDAKLHDPWPYEFLLPYLDASVDRGTRFVFVLAGSSGASLEEIKQQIAARPKGRDLLSRIPAGHEYVIGPMTLGDRLLIVLSQLRQAGQEMDREIRAIEKLGLYYVALNPRLANARQLREFAVRAVERVPRTDDRVKYDHLFVPGDPENKAFWVQASPVAERLANTFVILVGDGVGVTPFRARESIEARPRTNLPRQLTSFIGRTREIEEVKRLLPTTGLLTITGAGGVGKTRLALRVAEELVDQYPDGVWLAQLASLSEPTLVPKAVASALNIPEQPGRPLTETVADYLRRRTLLIMLDNCEHLLQACTHLVDTLLRTSPNLRVLATSREMLGIDGELIYRIPSLSVPDVKRLPPPDALTEYEAVRLFAERAAFSKPGFELNSGNAAVVALLVDRLDGIPLAIELAAARVKALPVDVIATRLDDQFRMLTGGSRTGLRRHQTLRATLDWSYDLLLERERTLLRRLSVFAGGWTLEAAEKICSGKGVGERNILDLLTRLVEKSLVVFDEREGHARYRLLETVRQYGRDKLQKSGDADDVQRRHCEWYLDLAEQADPKLRGNEQELWLERIATEHDNLQTALAWGRTDPQSAEAWLRLIRALYYFWLVTEHWTEGRRWLEEAITRGDEADPAILLAILLRAGGLAYRQGDDERAGQLAEQALVLSRTLKDKEGEIWALTLSGLVVFERDPVQATPLFEEGVALARDLGDKWMIGFVLLQLADVPRFLGDYERATSLYMESIDLCRQVGDKWRTAIGLLFIGVVSLRQREYSRAGVFFAESLLLCRRGDLFVTFQCLEGLGCVASARGNYVQAARLFGAAELLRESLGSRRDRDYQRDIAQHMNSAQTALGNTAFASAWAEGRALTLEQAIEYALTPAG